MIRRNNEFIRGHDHCVHPILLEKYSLVAIGDNDIHSGGD